MLIIGQETTKSETGTWLQWLNLARACQHFVIAGGVHLRFLLEATPVTSFSSREARSGIY
jgi:hypothetical protein